MSMDFDFDDFNANDASKSRYDRRAINSRWHRRSIAYIDGQLLDANIRLGHSGRFIVR